MAQRRIYKIYRFGMYSKYRVFSDVLDTSMERLEQRRKDYQERGFDCGDIRLYPYKTSEKDYWDVITH